MHCFYHPSVDAVGVCKNCQRGLCMSCAAEVINGLACRNRCEAEVAALDRVIQRSKGLTGPGALVFAAIGALFIVGGTVTLPGGWPFLILGLLFLGFSLVQFISGRSRAAHGAKPSA